MEKPNYLDFPFDLALREMSDDDTTFVRVRRNYRNVPFTRTSFAFSAADEVNSNDLTIHTTPRPSQANYVTPRDETVMDQPVSFLLIIQI